MSLLLFLFLFLLLLNLGVSLIVSMLVVLLLNCLFTNKEGWLADYDKYEHCNCAKRYAESGM